MTSGALGREFNGGDVIVHQGEIGDCMYVIQEGEVEVVRVENGSIVRLAVLGRRIFSARCPSSKKKSDQPLFEP